MPLSSPPAAPQRGDRTTFAARVDAFITWLIGFVSELNIFSANLNSIAAGGAYAIPYTWGTGASAGLLNVGGGPAQQYLATSLDISNVASSGVDISPLLQFDQSTSAVKGHIRIVKVGDPTKFMVFAVTSRTNNATYQWVQGAMVEATAANPFANGDAVLLYFQRTGDKGDPGNTGFAKFSDRKAQGVGGGNAPQNSTITRDLNTIDANTIGATLGGNLFTLPAGKYVIQVRAPAWATGIHRISLYNSTDGSTAAIGANANAAGTAPMVTDATLTVYLNLTAPKAFQVIHYTATNQTTNGLGYPLSRTGEGETYTEVIAWKLQ